jgi:hypothetical protein
MIMDVFCFSISLGHLYLLRTRSNPATQIRRVPVALPLHRREVGSFAPLGSWLVCTAGKLAQAVSDGLLRTRSNPATQIRRVPVALPLHRREVGSFAPSPVETAQLW